MGVFSTVIPECFYRGYGLTPDSRLRHAGMTNNRDFRMKYRIDIIILTVLLVCLISLLCKISYAEDKEEEKKITIEKTEVIGVLERPAVIFPVRWKYPEGQPAKTLTPERSFKEEIFELIDLETIRQEGLWE